MGERTPEMVEKLMEGVETERGTYHAYERDDGSATTWIVAEDRITRMSRARPMPPGIVTPPVVTFATEKMEVTT